MFVKFAHEKLAASEAPSQAKAHYIFIMQGLHYIHDFFMRFVKTLPPLERSMPTFVPDVYQQRHRYAISWNTVMPPRHPSLDPRSNDPNR